MLLSMSEKTFSVLRLKASKKNAKCGDICIFLNAMTINESNVDWREQRRERGGGQVEEGSGREHRHRQVGQVVI